ncbi:tetratricopeptide repeat protein, partial [Nonomuraea cavernae]|uniref:tetratricopeptide repeat protein n=1 Tax=Nonomuraea cavernae TaxID=2045107 RepID=UPI0033DEBBC4
MGEIPLSLQEIVRRRQRSSFVGRTGQLAQFQQNLGLSLDDERRRFIFNIHGNAGVGKSFLVQQLRHLVSEKGGICAFSDENARGIPETLGAIASDFASQGKRLKSLEERLATYADRLRETEADPDAPQDTGGFLTKTAVKVGLHTAKSIPVAGSLVELVDAEALTDQANKFRVYLSRKFRNHGDIRLLLSPADELTPILIQELAVLGDGGKPLALFFDTYERTSTFLDDWLLDLLTGRYGALPATLIITIAGQVPLNPNRWSAYLGITADIPLVPFTEIEARQLLASKGIDNESVVEVILSLSGGLPLLVAMLAENKPDDLSAVGDRSGDAVERFLKWEDDAARRSVALTAAFPRRFNQDILNILVDEIGGESQGAYEWLRQMPFVADSAGTCQYHDVVRASMLRMHRNRSPQTWRRIHTRLADVHADWRQCFASDSRDAWKSAAWQNHTLDRIYHLLCANPMTSMSEILEQSVYACRTNVSIVNRLLDTINQAIADSGDEDLRSWGRRLSESLPDGESDTTGFLSVIIDLARYLPDVEALARSQRAWHAYYADQEQRALGDFNRAIELAPDNVWTISRRGQTYCWIGRYSEALADFSRAIELDPADAWATAHRGETYRLVKRYDEALADFSRAIELDPADAWAITNRGETYREMER